MSHELHVECTQLHDCCRVEWNAWMIDQRGATESEEDEIRVRGPKIISLSCTSDAIVSSSTT